MPTPSPETPPQLTFTPERFLVAAIVAPVVGSNVTLIALMGTDYIQWDAFLVTAVSTVVLLGIVPTARHPKSIATWVTTGMNALGTGALSPLFIVSPTDSIIVMLIVSVLYPVTLLLLGHWLYKNRGGPRAVRHYQLWSWWCWAVFVFPLSLMSWIATVVGGSDLWGGA